MARGHRPRFGRIQGSCQRSDRIGLGRIGSDRIGSDQIGSDRIRLGWIGSDRIGSHRIGLDRVWNGFSIFVRRSDYPFPWSLAHASVCQASASAGCQSIPYPYLSLCFLPIGNREQTGIQAKLTSTSNVNCHLHNKAIGLHYLEE